MDYYLGIDGGGTRTSAVLCDGSGNIITKANAGGLNYRAMGYDGARASLRDIMSQITLPVRAAFIGNAALAAPAPAEELRALTHGIIDAAYIGMDSDLFIALEAMRCAGPCAVAIAGTGSMAAGRAGAGEPILHTGGWGWLLGDEGSAFHIAWEALRAGLRGYEGSGPATTLSGDLCRFFGAYPETPEELLDLFYDPPKERHHIAACAKVVLQSDDPVAREIVRRCAADFAGTARALLRNLPEDTTLGLWGGMFQHSVAYTRAFCGALGRQAELLPTPPEMGAVYAAMKLCKGSSI